MKVNSKTTNDENSAATLTCHQGGQRTVNGIIGNTRRGIRVDQTLDPNSNNPVANKPVSTALVALAGKIDAALQEPTGLTKTALVGVGVNGQENIEIGDNLTLANGKLSSAAAGGSLPSTITFDSEGNRKVGKNLGVDGKLTLKSLVSESNPDGDITKELGGGGGGSQIHVYSIYLENYRSSSDYYPYSSFHYEVYTTKDYKLEKGKATKIENFTDDNYVELRSPGIYPAGGYYSNNVSNKYIVVSQIDIIKNNKYNIQGYNPSGDVFTNALINEIVGAVSAVKVVQLF